MHQLTGEALVTAARAIATVAHAGQTDKTGADYIGHPQRVATRVAGNARDEAVAWLHDVLEDTSVTVDALLAAGMPEEVVDDVRLLTRTPHQRPEDYYGPIKDSYSARRVKLADIADNTSVDRLALIDDDATVARLVRKYAKARRLLGAAD